MALAEEIALTVTDAARLALSNNPALRAAAIAIDEAKARLQDSGRLPNPELESTFAPHLGGRERSFTAGFNQSFPVTGRLAAEKRLSQLHVVSSEAEVAEFKRKLALQVRTAAIRSSILEAQRRLNDRQQQNSRELKAAAREALKVGEGSEIETAQLELESGRLLAKRALLERSFSEVNGELKALLGFDTSTLLTIAPLPTVPGTNDLLQRFPLPRSDYRVALGRVEAARQGVRLARAQQWEDITVGVFTEMDRNEDVPKGLETDHIVGVRVSVPIPIWNRRKGRVAEMEASSRRAELEAIAIQAQIESERSTALDHVRVESRLLEATSRDLLPKARQLEERLLHLHAQGQSTFTDVLRAREQRLELESAELDAQRDFHLAHARFLAAMGREE